MKYSTHCQSHSPRDGYKDMKDFRVAAIFLGEGMSDLSYCLQFSLTHLLDLALCSEIIYN